MQSNTGGHCRQTFSTSLDVMDRKWQEHAKRKCTTSCLQVDLKVEHKCRSMSRWSNGFLVLLAFPFTQCLLCLEWRDLFAATVDDLFIAAGQTQIIVFIDVTSVSQRTHLISQALVIFVEREFSLRKWNSEVGNITELTLVSRRRKWQMGGEFLCCAMQAETWQRQRNPYHQFWAIRLTWRPLCLDLGPCGHAFPKFKKVLSRCFFAFSFHPAFSSLSSSFSFHLSALPGFVTLGDARALHADLGFFSYREDLSTLPSYQVFLCLFTLAFERMISFYFKRMQMQKMRRVTAPRLV